MATLVQVLSNLILSPLLSISFQPIDFSTVNYFNSFNSLFAPIIGLTLTTYYSRTFFKKGLEERIILRETVASTLLIVGTLSLVFVLAGFFLFSRDNSSAFAFYPNALLCYTSILFGNLYALYLVDLRLAKQARSFFNINVINHLIYFAVMVVLCVLLRWGASGSFAATLIVSVGFGIYSLSRTISRIRIDKKVLFEALSFCWPLIVGACFAYFTDGVDRILLSHLKNTYDYTLYSIALKFSGYLFLFYQVINMTMEPDYYKALAENRKKRFIRLAAAALSMNAIIVLLFYFFSPLIIHVLTLGRYDAAYKLTRILVLKNISSSVFYIVSVVIFSYGYPKVTMLNRIFAGLIVGMLFKFMIGRFGFFGAAWGHVISYLLMSLISGSFIIYLFYQKKRARNKLRVV